MATIKVLRGNTSSIANYAGQAGEVALNYETGNLVFWTNTANTYYTLAREGADTPIYTPLQGSTSGYSAGGSNPPSTPTYTNIIDKFPFSSDTSATDIANLTTVKIGMAGQKGSTHGYFSGGSVDIPTQGSDDQIQKFSFTSDSDAVNIGTLTGDRHYTSGQSSLTHGYTSGGIDWVPTPFSLTYVDTIDKFPFSSDTNASDVGELGVTGGGPGVAGGSSQTHGYVVGGGTPTLAVRDAIQKFSFSSDSSSIDVGEIGVDHPNAMAVSSSTNIYMYGQFPSPYTGPATAVRKAPFISDTPATEVLQMAAATYQGGGASSTTDGYFLGGRYGPVVDFIQKFPFSSDTDAVDIGELVLGRFWITGNQT